MEANNRRDFLKKAALAGASALMAPTLLAAEGKDGSEFVLSPSKKTDSKLIVPKNNGLKITGTFLDEISHDIPHQNWGEKEWDLDFQHMKRIGIDTVIMIRSGYRKFITYPSKYLLGKGCYMPSVDLVDMYLRLAEKYNMKFYFGLYDTGHYWDTRDMSWEVAVSYTHLVALRRIIKKMLYLRNIDTAPFTYREFYLIISTPLQY